MFIDMPKIAEGAEKPPPLSTPLTDEECNQLENWKKQSQQGLSHCSISIKPTVHQSLDMSKSLTENWSTLKAAYGTHTRLNFWVDCGRYHTFTTTKSLTQKIDAMFELDNCIVQTILPITC